MNRYSFIHREKKDLIELKLDGLIPKLKLNLENKIKKTDGKVFCVKCSFQVEKNQENIPERCPECRSELKWDLMEQWEEQSSIISKFNILELYLGNCLPKDKELKTLYDFKFFSSALDLLNDKQKEIVFNYLIRKSAQTRLELEEIKLLVKNIFELLKDISKEIGEIRNKPTGIEPFKKELKDEVENSCLYLNSHITEKVQEEIKIQKEETFRDSDKFNKDLEFEKIKKTLNIMMDLFQYGLDLPVILMKAKVDLDNQFTIGNLSLNNELNMDNDGNYINSTNLKNHADQLFNRFDY